MVVSRKREYKKKEALSDIPLKGDVETTKIVKAATEDGKTIIEGLSGRKLTLGDWKNPSGDYRVGLKRAYELFPSDLTSRIKKVENCKKKDVNFFF